MDNKTNYQIKDDIDIDIAIVECFGYHHDLPEEEQIINFYKKLVFLNDDTKAIWTKEKIYESVKFFIEDQIDLQNLEKKRKESISFKTSDEREKENFIFDSNFELLNGNKDDVKQLMKNAYNKESIQTDAILLFGIHLIAEGKDIKYGLSLVADSAQKRNDRAAYILGWLNETKLIFSTINNDNNYRKWYRESAERGYQPSIEKMIEMIQRGFYSASEQELLEWKRKVDVIDIVETQRLDYIKSFLIKAVNTNTSK